MKLFIAAKPTGIPKFLQDIHKEKMKEQIEYFNLLKFKFRLRKVDQYFIAEYPKKNIFGKTKWIPLITYYGSKDAFPYVSKENVLNDIYRMIAKDLRR